MDETDELYLGSNHKVEAANILKNYLAVFPWYVDDYPGNDTIDQTTLAWHKAHLKNLGQYFSNSFVGKLTGKIQPQHIINKYFDEAQFT